jgi:hypothetical protein
MRPYVYNRLWSATMQPPFRRFEQSIKEPQDAQRRYLETLLRRNAHTLFGRQYSFAGMRTIENFQSRVPLSAYEDYQPFINKIAAGETAVLSADPVRLFQTSSGSRGASKLIPYTRSLKNEFQRGVSAWMASLFRQMPELLRGRAYWSLTPPAQQPKKFGQIRVGFDDDAEYLSPLARLFYRGSSAVPPAIAGVTDMDSLLDNTLAYLVAARDLTLISVWSPTFLTLLMRRLDERAEEVLNLLGTRQLPGLRLEERRLYEITSILRGPPREHTAALWPALRLISCWTDGSSSLFVQDIKNRFPGVAIQGKGLIATEAFVSLPFVSGCDPLPALDSHFLEFIEPAGGRIRLAHQLQAGELYELAVTTGGGLYRYRLGDLVRVTGHVGRTPTLRFVSKINAVDLCGEKLQAEYVETSVGSAIQETGLEVTFFLLAPVKTQNAPSYCLFIETRHAADDILARLLRNVEARLLDNFHYEHCRRLGQLGALKLFSLDNDQPPAEQTFTEEMRKRGLKLGSIKMAHLDPEYGWETRFKGRYL